ncbi:MAG TPA: cellulase family glycosylhydrolase [Longilinea sp.]|nr:cellulase family glycosylhydrolase [Longilinea sp.]
MIRINGPHFIDDQGRQLMLRGVNLSGSAKVPYTPDGATHIFEGFFDHRQVSFVGRPFPLEEADEHFRRLRSWGLTFLRFLTTWEAVEHAGPGKYDEEYLDYLYKVVKKAGEYGITLFIDPHEDVWSRFSGGDGAPGWTFEAAGMDITGFKATGAAIVHQTLGDPFPRMIWASNNSKLAAATMWTLFFAGKDFAPQCKVDGKSIQDYLQSHYIAAMRQVAHRLKEFDHVIGYDTLNEPSTGYIGITDFNAPPGREMIGPTPTVLQSMALGDGISQPVQYWKRDMLGGINRQQVDLTNQEGRRAWLEGKACIWRQHGVWDVDANGKPVVLKPDYFSSVNGKKVDFVQDYLLPFWNRYAGEIRKEKKDAMIFVEGAPGEGIPTIGEADLTNIVFAGHWYDGITLFFKRFIPFMGMDFFKVIPLIGVNKIKKSFVAQMAHFRTLADEKLRGAPVVIGEFGIPYDLNGAKAYRNGNFTDQINAMARSMAPMEANLLNFTIWDYTPDNTNERGDKWNGEDLSIFSRDQQKDAQDINSGGRALEAVLRPYPMATAGSPTHIAFDHHSGRFEFTYTHDPKISAATIVYVPNFQYPNGYQAVVSDGEYKTDTGSQRLEYRHSSSQAEHTITITRK